MTAGIEAVALDLARLRDRHLADHAQAIDLGLERAELVRQPLGQHRNHAPREIHRLAALARVDVERVAVANVVADVGDGDDQPEALARRARNRRRRRSRCAVSPSMVTSGRAREIDAALRGRRGCTVVAASATPAAPLPARTRAAGRACAARSRSPCRGRRSCPALPPRARAPRRAPRLLDDLGDDDLSRLGAPAHVRRNQNVLGDALVLGDEEPDAALFIQPADDLAIRAFDDFDDGGLRPAAPVDARLRAQ